MTGHGSNSSWQIPAYFVTTIIAIQNTVRASVTHVNLPFIRLQHCRQRACFVFLWNCLVVSTKRVDASATFSKFSNVRYDRPMWSFICWVSLSVSVINRFIRSFSRPPFPVVGMVGWCILYFNRQFSIYIYPYNHHPVSITLIARYNNYNKQFKANEEKI